MEKFGILGFPFGTVALAKGYRSRKKKRESGELK